MSGTLGSVNANYFQREVLGRKNFPLLLNVLLAGLRMKLTDQQEKIERNYTQCRGPIGTGGPGAVRQLKLRWYLELRRWW